MLDCVSGIGAMDCSSLARKWEANQCLRLRIRETKDLMILNPEAKWVEPTRANAVLHASVLLPALEVLGSTPDKKLPYLTSLQAELGDTYQSILGASNEKTIYRNAQEIKRLLGLVKRKAFKKEVTKDFARLTSNIQGFRCMTWC